MTEVKQLLTEHLDIWLSAEASRKSGRGRSSGSSDTIYGVQKLRELILELASKGKLIQLEDSNPDLEATLKGLYIEKVNYFEKNNIKYKPFRIVPIQNSNKEVYPKHWVTLKYKDIFLKINSGGTRSYSHFWCMTHK